MSKEPKAWQVAAAREISNGARYAIDRIWAAFEGEGIAAEQAMVIVQAAIDEAVAAVEAERDEARAAVRELDKIHDRSKTRMPAEAASLYLRWLERYRHLLDSEDK